MSDTDVSNDGPTGAWGSAVRAPSAEVILTADNLVKTFPTRGSALGLDESAQSTALRSSCIVVRRSASSANPAAASRRSRACSSG